MKDTDLIKLIADDKAGAERIAPWLRPPEPGSKGGCTQCGQEWILLEAYRHEPSKVVVVVVFIGTQI